MGVTSVDGSGKSNIYAGQLKQDSYEKNIQKQIDKLQERMQNINNDKEKSIEQKMNEKKEIQKQIQSLNSELRQYQVQKRQREAVKRQEAAQRAAGNNNHTKQDEKSKAGISEAVNGVMVTLSNTKEQISGMKKVRTDLQGKLRTAGSAEEKEALQRKIDKLNEDIGRKIKESQDTIEEYQASEKEKTSDNKTEKSESIQDKEAGKEEYDDISITANKYSGKVVTGAKNPVRQTEESGYEKAEANS